MGHAGKNWVQFFLMMQGWKVMVIMQQQQLQQSATWKEPWRRRCDCQYSICNDTIDKVRLVALPVCFMHTWEHSCFPPLLTRSIKYWHQFFFSPVYTGLPCSYFCSHKPPSWYPRSAPKLLKTLPFILVISFFEIIIQLKNKFITREHATL